LKILHATGKQAVLIVVTAFLTLTFLAPALAGQTSLSLSQAIFNTLDSNPLVSIQKEEIHKSQGLLQKASGEFDWIAFNELSYQQNVPVPTVDRLYDEDLRERSSTYSIGTRKKLRNGISIAPTLSAHYYVNNLNQENGKYYGNVGLEIVIPLMQGRGRNVNQAFENSSTMNLAATVGLAKYHISKQIHATVIAYWNCLLATQKVILLSKIITSSKKRLAHVKRLVEAGEADQPLFEATRKQLFSHQADLVRERLILFRSKQVLGLAMGYSDTRLSETIILEGNFPSIPKKDIFEETILTANFKYLIDNRGDYQASGAKVKEADVLLTRARNDLRPRLDLKLQAGFPNYFAGLNLIYPFGNNVAKGEFLHQRSQANQAKLHHARRFERIAVQIRMAVENLRAMITEGRLARKLVEIHRKEMDVMQNKTESGEISDRELLNFQERYWHAKIEEIRIQQKYAAALTEFSFVAGTLMQMDDENYRFNLSSLLKVDELKGITKID